MMVLHQLTFKYSTDQWHYTMVLKFKQLSFDQWHSSNQNLNTRYHEAKFVLIKE
jgi:hypothetical protein